MPALRNPERGWIATANNQGRLTVGLDDVKLNIKIADSGLPTVGGLKLRNPGFLLGPLSLILLAARAGSDGNRARTAHPGTKRAGL